MSVQIKGFSQPSTVTVSSFDNGGSSVVSSFGPKNMLRLRADASVWSKSGGSCQIRGIGNRSLLHAKSLRLVCPLEIRFKQPGNDRVVVPNCFLDSIGQIRDPAAAQQTKASVFHNSALGGGAEVFNGLSMRTNATPQQNKKVMGTAMCIR